MPSPPMPTVMFADPQPPAPVPTRRIVIFSGGSAANSLVDVFNEVVVESGSGGATNTSISTSTGVSLGASNSGSNDSGVGSKCSLTYVIPISDNGGSSSELIRVFGGPGIGDVRSRLVRLIPRSHTHIFHLFNHRLPPASEPAAAEFLTLLTGTSPLYAHLPTAQAMLIRSIFSHLHLEILKRTRPPTSTFNFQSASIGNLFLTGARLFSGSFESAIYLLALMGGVDEAKTAVLPAIMSNFSHHISAGLADGSSIAGQNAISHPSEPTALANLNDRQSSPLGLNPAQVDSTIEDATLPGSLPTLRQASISFSKLTEDSLPARIDRVWYINPYGQEMRPPPNPKVLDAVNSADAVIYSIGSLYTSIIPSLILQDVGSQISRSGGPRSKIFILNGSLDRETPEYTASDFLDAVARACMESEGHTFGSGERIPRVQWCRYVTHLIHLEGEGAPEVEKDELSKWGIEAVRLYGRKGGDGTWRYDGKALAQALTAILGKRERRERSRRNTGT